MLQITSIVEDAESSAIPDDVRAVLMYWQELREARFAPSWKDFQLDELDPRIIPWCSVADVIDDGEDYRYRFWGTAREPLQRKNMTWQSVHDLKPPALAENIWDQYAEILNCKKPAWFKTRACIDNRHEFNFQYLRMPFSDNDADINMIFGVCYNRYSPRELESIFSTA